MRGSFQILTLPGRKMRLNCTRGEGDVHTVHMNILMVVILKSSEIIPYGILICLMKPFARPEIV